MQHSVYMTRKEQKFGRPTREKRTELRHRRSTRIDVIGYLEYPNVFSDVLHKTVVERLFALGNPTRCSRVSETNVFQSDWMVNNELWIRMS